MIDASNLEVIDTTKTFSFGAGGGVRGHEVTPRVIDYMLKKGISMKEFQRRNPAWVAVNKNNGIITGIYDQKPVLTSINMRVGGKLFTDKFQSNTSIYPWKHIDLPQEGQIFKQALASFGSNMPRAGHQESEKYLMNFGDNVPETDKEIKAFKVYQIYFNSSTQRNIEQAFTPYHNARCNKYFENSVILDVHDNKRDEWIDKAYVGVLSHKFFQVTHLHWFDVANRIAARGADAGAYAFWSQAPHNPVPISNQHHPFFTKIVHRILIERMGMDAKILNQTYKCFYRNYWIAKPELFSSYVMNFLKPIMAIMEDQGDQQLQEWLWKGANYHQHLGRQRMKAIFGKERRDYTHHTFVLERMPIFFFNLAGIKLELIS